MRKLLVVLVSAVLLLGAVVAVAIADPGLEPTAAFGPHKHFLQKADGTLVEFGPRVCEDGANSPNWGAFLQFHANHHSHAGLTGAIGPVAPGINDADGPKLVRARAASTRRRLEESGEAQLRRLPAPSACRPETSPNVSSRYLTCEPRSAPARRRRGASARHWHRGGRPVPRAAPLLTTC